MHSIFYNTYNYFRQGDYVFIDICLFVNSIAHKRLNRFSQNSVNGGDAPRKKSSDFGGNPNHVTLGLWLGWSTVGWLRVGGGRKTHNTPRHGVSVHVGRSHTPRHRVCFERLFNSNNFTGSEPLVEVCALLRAILVTLRTKLSGAVYCNRSCLWVCLCVFAGLFVCGSVTAITRNCVHRSSPNWVCT